MTERPLIPLTLSFVLGVLLARYMTPLLPLVLLLFCLLAGIFALTRRPLLGGAALMLAFLLLGSARTLSLSRPATNDVSLFSGQDIAVTGVVESDVTLTSLPQSPGMRTARFVLRALEARPRLSDLFRPASGHISVRLVLHEEQQKTRVSQNRADIAPHYGDRIALEGMLEKPDGARNPGGFDNRKFLAESGIYSAMGIRRPDQWRILQRQGAQSALLLRLAYALKRRVMEHAGAGLTPLHRSVLNGILVGDRGGLPGELNDDFGRTGTSHILATAGLHVGLFVMFVLALLRGLSVPLRPAQGVTLLLLVLYALMAGGRPAVVRAVTIAIVYLAGALLEREPDLPSAVALAALLQLLYNPRSLFDAGFQMSFATVITIALLLPFAESTLYALRSRRRKGEPGARLGWSAFELLCGCGFLTLAAQVGATPLVAVYFHEFALIALAANLLVVPVITLVLGLGFAAALLGSLFSWLALPLYPLLDLLLSYIIYVVQGCARLPFACLSMQAPSLPFLMGYYGILWGLAWLWRPQTNNGEMSPEIPQSADLVP